MKYPLLRRIQLLVLQSRGRNPSILRRPNTKLHIVRTTSIFARTGYWDSPLRPIFSLARQGRSPSITANGSSIGMENLLGTLGIKCPMVED